jgi:hypothetical protein
MRSRRPHQAGLPGRRGAARRSSAARRVNCRWPWPGAGDPRPRGGRAIRGRPSAGNGGLNASGCAFSHRCCHCGWTVLCPWARGSATCYLLPADAVIGASSCAHTLSCCRWRAQSSVRGTPLAEAAGLPGQKGGPAHASAGDCGAPRSAVEQGAGDGAVVGSIYTGSPERGRPRSSTDGVFGFSCGAAARALAGCRDRGRRRAAPRAARGFNARCCCCATSWAGLETPGSGWYGVRRRRGGLGRGARAAAAATGRQEGEARPVSLRARLGLLGHRGCRVQRTGSLSRAADGVVQKALACGGGETGNGGNCQLRVLGGVPQGHLLCVDE